MPVVTFLNHRLCKTYVIRRIHTIYLRTLVHKAGLSHQPFLWDHEPSNWDLTSPTIRHEVQQVWRLVHRYVVALQNEPIDVCLNSSDGNQTNSWSELLGLLETDTQDGLCFPNTDCHIDISKSTYGMADPGISE